jgi:hypothetical protein
LYELLGFVFFQPFFFLVKTGEIKNLKNKSTQSIIFFLAFVAATSKLEPYLYYTGESKQPAYKEYLPLLEHTNRPSFSLCS